MKSVLVIEDQDDLVELIVNAVGEMAEVKACSTIEKAEKVLRDNTFDLIVSDINLPDGNSHLLFHDLGSEKKLPPIIYISGEDNIESKVVSFATGGRDYLCKPFDLRELRLRIAVQLDESQSLGNLVTTR